MSKIPKPTWNTPPPIKQRILEGLAAGLDSWYPLMDWVFPEEHFPNAMKMGNGGGPPGCVMAFGRALRQLGYRRDLDSWKIVKS